MNLDAAPPDAISVWASLRHWLSSHEGVLLWMGGASVGFLVLSLALIPMLIARLPADYFAHQRRHGFWIQRLSPALRACALTGKNLLGLIVGSCGLLMLVLPGQGLLTLLIGLSLIDFPGKYRLERWLLGRRAVFRSLNWLRQQLGKPAFVEPFRERASG